MASRLLDRCGELAYLKRVIAVADQRGRQRHRARFATPLQESAERSELGRKVALKGLRGWAAVVGHAFPSTRLSPTDRRPAPLVNVRPLAAPVANRRPSAQPQKRRARDA